MGGNGRKMDVASECCAIWCAVYSSHLCMVLQPAFLGCLAHFLSMTDQLRTFKGVCYAVLSSKEGMGQQVDAYKCLFRKGECTDALKAEWDVYWKLPITIQTPNCRILDWWHGMSATLPFLYAVADGSLLSRPLHVTWNVASPHQRGSDAFNWGGGGSGKRAQLTGPFISYHEL